MRIIAGRLGGRLFEAPHGHRTHPMGDKIRGALFNTLGDIEGLSLLDAYAGSGAIGFEAISRGASKVIAVEADKPAQTCIKINITSLQVAETYTLINSFIMSFVRRTHETFDIVVADPPYDNLVYKDLEALDKVVKVGGLLVYSLPPTARIILPKNFELLSTKSYGDATLSFYRKN